MSYIICVYVYMHIHAQKFIALIHKFYIYIHSTHFFGSLVTLMFQTLF